jgi:hypothetical protein
MITTETEELLRQLRSGNLDTTNLSGLESHSASELIFDLKSRYSLLFQERHIGRKCEVGLARSRRVELDIRRTPNTLFASASLQPVLSRCLFLSSYDDAISEITIIASLHLHPKSGSDNQVILKMGKGFKLDRTPDGWTLKALQRRSVTLTEVFLAKRGWKFEALVPLP